VKVIVEDAVLRTLFKFPSCKDPHETDVLNLLYIPCGPGSPLLKQHPTVAYYSFLVRFWQRTLSPADGLSMSFWGAGDDTGIFSAKGHEYAVRNLRSVRLYIQSINKDCCSGACCLCSGDKRIRLPGRVIDASSDFSLHGMMFAFGWDCAPPELPREP
jgi:hypothetical protein